MTVVTRAEFARRMNVNRSTVTRWIESGRIKTDEAGNINLEQAQAMLPKTASPMPHHMARSEQIAEEKAAAQVKQPKQHAHPALPLPLPDEPQKAADVTSDMDRADSAALRLKLARARREEEEAQIAAMKRAETAKQLVRRVDAEFVMRDFARTVGALLERLADHYTPVIMACSGNPQAVHKALSDAARDIRSELSHQMRRRADERLGAGASAE